jgi:uncharacterized protein HemY
LERALPLATAAGDGLMRAMVLEQVALHRAAYEGREPALVMLR